MAKAKSVFITIIMAAMVALIVTGLFYLHRRSCLAIIVLLACYGYIIGAANLCTWLQKEPTEPQHDLDKMSPWENDDERKDYIKLFEDHAV